MKDIYTVLEFDRIKNSLVRYASMDKSKNDILSLEYINDKDKIIDEISYVSSAFDIVVKYGNPIIYQVKEIADYISLVDKGYMLSIEEMYNILLILKSSSSIVDFFNTNKMEESNSIVALSKQIINLSSLEKEVSKCIDDDGNFKESASKELKRITDSISSLERELRKKLNEIVNLKKDIVNGGITIKDDRLVIPVSSSFKAGIEGSVVEHSYSKQTTYIEPAIATEYNNRIAKLKNDYVVEVNRILRELNDKIRVYIVEINNNYNVLNRIDFLFAKAMYAYKTHANKPTVNDNKEIVLKGLWHPFIDEKVVVKNNLEFRKENILLISGPNAGGKTVLLKSISLSCLLMQCGMFVYASSASLPIFSSFYLDIGDNQSIINSLSTFSSHIVNLKHIVENVDENSFVILDEIGSSTDPKEGEGLAIAITDYLIKKDVKGIITTHFGALKAYGLEEEKVMSVSMEFNLDTLLPTYRLKEGVSGKSYAYEISTNLGLSSDIIDSAKRFKDMYSSKMEKVLEDLEEKNEKYSFLVEDYKLKNEELENKINENEKFIELLKEEIRKVKKTSNEQIDEIVEEAKEKIDDIIKSLDGNNKLHELIKAKKDLESAYVDEGIEESSEVSFSVDEDVLVKKLNRIGKILSIKDDSYIVQLDNMKMTIKGIDLGKVDAKKVKKKTRTISSSFGNKTVSPELNLIGKRAEEAKNELLSYLDGAKRCSMKEVRIIHGFGTGALRNMVWEVIKSDKMIKEARYGGANEGGMGATIIIFK